jgi:hypothetical protein
LIRTLLRRCLEKDRKRRLDSAADARLEIDDALTRPEPQAAAVSGKSGRRGTLAWAVEAVLAVALLALAIPAWLHFRETPPAAPQSVRFEIAPPGNFPAQMFTLSPDGRFLAFSANTGGPNQLWVRPMDGLNARVLAGTDGATYPFWSPDGANLGFFAQGKLKKIAVAGGPVQTLCEAADGRGGTWNRDGIILFSAGPTSPILRISSAGGAPTAQTALVAADVGYGHRFPAFLPDGVHYLSL